MTGQADYHIARLLHQLITQRIDLVGGDTIREAR